MPYVSKRKIEFVRALTEELKKGKVIGLVNIRGIPAVQMASIRKKLKNSGIFFRVSKNNLLKLALKDVNPETEALSEYIEDQCGVVCANMNPFKLYKELMATITPAPAKGGEIAPDDIYVKKGETNYPPGPLIGDFQRAGIPAAIEKGKIVIKSDKLLVKKGEVIPRDVALALTKLEIYPMEVGLRPIAIYDDGIVYKPEQLHIDPERYLGDIQAAYRNAFNLAFNIGYPTRDTIEVLVLKANTEARNLAINAAIFEKSVMEDIISLCHGQMLSLTMAIKEVNDYASKIWSRKCL